MNKQPQCPREDLAALTAAHREARRVSSGDCMPLDPPLLADKLAHAGHEHAAAFGELARAPFALPRLHPTAARPVACGSWWAIDCRAYSPGALPGLWAVWRAGHKVVSFVHDQVVVAAPADGDGAAGQGD
jgi:hypothetical protein